MQRAGPPSLKARIRSPDGRGSARDIARRCRLGVLSGRKGLRRACRSRRGPKEVRPWRQRASAARTVNPSAYAYPGSNPGSATHGKGAPDQRKRWAGALRACPAVPGRERLFSGVFAEYVLKFARPGGLGELWNYLRPVAERLRLGVGWPADASPPTTRSTVARGLTRTSARCSKNLTNTLVVAE